MKYTKDIIAIIVIILAGISLFVTTVDVNAVGFIRVAGGVVIGYYFGTKDIPFSTQLKSVGKSLKRKK